MSAAKLVIMHFAEVPKLDLKVDSKLDPVPLHALYSLQTLVKLIRTYKNPV